LSTAVGITWRLQLRGLWRRRRVMLEKSVEKAEKMSDSARHGDPPSKPRAQRRCRRTHHGMDFQNPKTPHTRPNSRRETAPQGAQRHAHDWMTADGIFRQPQGHRGVILKTAATTFLMRACAIAGAGLQRCARAQMRGGVAQSGRKRANFRPLTRPRSYAQDQERRAQETDTKKEDDARGNTSGLELTHGRPLLGLKKKAA
jgi:hypothetical protein